MGTVKNRIRKNSRFGQPQGKLMVFFLFLFLVFIGCNDPQRASAQKTGNTDLLTLFNPLDSAELVFVPGGEFLMGSDAAELQEIWKKLGWNPEELQFTKTEQPAHRVRLDGFWIYRTLVTVSQYQTFAKSKGLQFPKPPTYGWKEDHPMVNISWEEANYYCTCMGGRLPREAEWEYAARGGKTGLDGQARTIFVWGDSFPSTPVGNLADETFLASGYYNNPNFHRFEGYTDGFATASPVRAFPPNSFGLYDMAGNVLEWCNDWYSENYNTQSPVENPKGPAQGTRRVLRGGAFDTTPTITRISRRLGIYPGIRNEEKGFRCVLN